MIKQLFQQYPTLFRFTFACYALLVLWASLRSGGGPQPIEHFDKLMHFLFYALFTILAAGCSLKKNNFFYLSLFIVAYGILMEVFQSFLPTRMMSLADIIANSSGVAMVVLVFIKLRLHN